MKSTYCLTAFLALILLGAAGFSGNASAQPSFTEGFSNNTYEKTGVTTADWNTTSAELRLWPFESTLKGVADTPGNAARSIAMAGSYAYVADGYYGIQVIDVSSPVTPVVVGTINTPGYVYQIFIDGNYVYVADHSGGLRVLDISDPVLPVEVASLSLPEVSLGITVKGNYAYLGNGGGGLAVVDITDPLNPTLAGIHEVSSGGVRNIKIAGDYAFVTAGDDGLLILDVSNPEGPYPAYNYQGQGFVRDLVVQGNYAYLSVSNSGLEVVDISDPTHPFLAGIAPGSGEMRGVFVDGDRVYLANDSSGLRVIDITNPTQPILKETIGFQGHAYDIEIAGQYAYVPCFGPGLQIIQISQSVKTTRIGTVEGAYAWAEPEIVGNYAYLPSENDGLRILDISNPEQPFQAAVINVGSSVSGVSISGDLGVLSLGINGIMVVDLTDPVVPVFLGQVNTPGSAFGVAINGDLVYVAAGESFQVVDISDPTNPVLIATHAVDNVTGVMIEGNLALAYSSGLFESKLEIIDISNIHTLTSLSTFDPTGRINDLEVRGDRVFIAGSGPHLMVVDLEDPTNPVMSGSWTSSSGFAGAIEVVGKRAYLAMNGTVQVVNITNPENPGSIEYDFQGGQHYAFLKATGNKLLAVGGLTDNTDILQIYQDDVDLTRSYAESNWYPPSTDPMARVRMSSTASGPVNWIFVVDGDYDPNVGIENTWLALDTPGSSLMWSAYLGFAPGTLSPVSQVKFEWLYDHPLIESVSDVPNDQGRQVRLQWMRSGHDFVNDELQIVEYAIYREIDEELTSKGASSGDLSGASSSLLENIQTMTGAGWDFVMTLPVLVEDQYAVVVPTLADSTVADGAYPTTFKVVALTATPGVYFASYPDSGSSVDNLAPNAPMAIMAAYGQDGVDLTWEEATEEDFRFFRIYRHTDPGFIPSGENLVQEVAVPAWTDEVAASWQFHYKVSAVDFSGNESLAGGVLHASDTPEVGAVFALHGAVPNPFNPSTRINYSLAEAGKVQLAIYDVAGRLVRTLVDDVLAAGDHQVRWDGRNDSGRTVASGAYFSILRSGDLTQRQRMMLMK